MTGTFINLTSHPTGLWSAEQLSAAGQYGHIINMPFPAVSPTAGNAEINALADECTAKIRTFEEPTVLVQGEFTLVFAIVTRLKAEGVRAVAACSAREIIESKLEDGAVMKKAVFRFKGFREY